MAPKVSSETQDLGVLEDDRKFITPETYEALSSFEKQSLL